jgi:hypothetical protein
LQIDYTFAVEGGKTITILTVRLVLTGWSAAVVVPFKGPVNYAVKWLAAFLRGAGARPYKLHCDAEASITSLAQATAEDLNNGSLVIRAPAGSHQSIGAVERHHQELHGAIRAQRAELEAKLGEKVPLDSPSTPGSSGTRGGASRASGCGGTSPYERLFGAPFDSPLAKFGEKVLARDPAATEGGKQRATHVRGMVAGARGRHQ